MIWRPRHPEAEADEELIGNMFAGDFKAVGWQSKRKARAYQLDGKRINTAGFISVLVSRREIEAAGVAIPDDGIMMPQATEEARAEWNGPDDGDGDEMKAARAKAATQRPRL